MKKILVAGGAGYVGSELVPALLEYGYDVKVIDLLWFGNSLPTDAEVIQKDLFECTEKDFEGIDVCINLSGISNDPGAEYDPVRNFIYNSALPPYLALISKRAGVKRYIQSSTCSVYGYTYDELKNEESNIQCNYPYGVSKYSGESGVIHLLDNAFSVICFRKGTISGFSKRMRFDLIVNTMFMDAMTRGSITINNPSIWRPIISMKDTVSAYLRAIQVHESINGIFNIAENNYTVGDVAETVKLIVEESTNSKVKLIVKDIKDIRNYKVDTAKASTILGFHPKYTVKDITYELVDTWNTFKDNFLEDIYYNIDICKKVFKKTLIL